MAGIAPLRHPPPGRRMRVTMQVTNTKRQLPTGEAAASGSVAISQVMTEPELVQRSEAFEQAIQGGDRDALSAFCRAREQEVGGRAPAASSLSSLFIFFSGRCDGGRAPQLLPSLSSLSLQSFLVPRQQAGQRCRMAAGREAGARGGWHGWQGRQRIVPAAAAQLAWFLRGQIGSLLCFSDLCSARCCCW